MIINKNRTICIPKTTEKKYQLFLRPFSDEGLVATLPEPVGHINNAIEVVVEIPIPAGGTEYAEGTP